MKKMLLFTLFLAFVASLSADEGMWMLQLLKHQKYADMKALGLKLQDYDIYNPDGSSLKDAVVQFGRGCTGEVVSSQGLVLTNHHCGYSYIQNHSTLENNYLENGFWAATPTEELPNPGLTVTFIEKIDDVTDYVKQCLTRDKAQDKDGVFFLSPTYLNRIARERFGEDSLKRTKGVEVEIKAFFNGNQYYLFTKKIYSDIRLVGAPPSSIGKFGADTDNWMWPRHTGDFSVFRIYADKNGEPADYSPDNRPLKPRRWLKISTKGVRENDFTMIMGFPGTTNKYYTSWEVAERRDIDNAVRINMRNIRQKAMLKEMLKDPAVKIQYAAKYSTSTNAYKNAIGTNWAIDLRDFEALKKEQQDKLLKWAQKKKMPQYAQALDQMDNIVKQRGDYRFRSWMLNEGILRGVEFASAPTAAADSLLKALDEGNEVAVAKYIAALQIDYRKFADKNYNPAVDKAVSTAMLSEYVRLVPRDQQPLIFRELYRRFNGNVTSAIEYVFDRSIFASEQNMQRFLASGDKARLLREDPMFLFAKSVREEDRRLRKELSRFDNPFDMARRTYLEGLLKMDGANVHFPDANATIRLSYGQVKGYAPRNAVSYDYQSTMDGVVQKEDPNNWEFVVPDKLKELYQTADFGNYKTPDGKMPVAFIATTHTTGGNSGSPVMNGNGELIGLNFDRNWEGVGGDIQYLPDYQRSIIVDIRYVLFIIDKYADTKRLIEEMDIM
ncbi:MAG: S46 family peptidase [Dysgonamonadaceae bacterium]|nr:S46 family peptidase [Dysgonamonadaceae bacterium]